LWSGYISSAPYDGNSHFNLFHPWPRAGFEIARSCGSTPIAFASGLDDPVALRSLAATWAVRLCLDVESGIRADGPWVQAWLDASGAGLYGNFGVHPNRRAAFHILAAYLGSGEPASTWWNQTLRPKGPCGWQWIGSHPEFGMSVDRGDYDDWFAGLRAPAGNTPTEDDMRTWIRNPATGEIAAWGPPGKRHVNLAEWSFFGGPPPGGLGDTFIEVSQATWDGIPNLGVATLTPADEQLLREAHDNIAKLVAMGPPGLTPAQAQQLQEAHDAVLTMAKTGSLTPAQALQLKEAHDLIVKDLK
jgi:hypothetical protein